MSIEADPELAEMARERFAGPYVYDVWIVTGDSADILQQLCPFLPVPTTFYLDAHREGYNPLLLELSAIAGSPHHERHTILIDDVRMFGREEWQYIGASDIFELLRRINPNYRYCYINTPNATEDLLVAQPR